MTAAVAAAAAGAILALAAPAPHHPFTLDATPAKVIAPAGARHVTFTETTANGGTEQLRITVSGLFLTPACRLATGDAASRVKASPAAFTLAPGQTRTVRVDVTAPGKAASPDDVLVVFSGRTPPARTGNVSLAGAVATRVELSPGGTASPARCGAARQPQAAAAQASGLPWLPGLGAAAGAALLAVAGGFLWRRKRLAAGTTGRRPPRSTGGGEA